MNFKIFFVIFFSCLMKQVLLAEESLIEKSEISKLQLNKEEQSKNENKISFENRFNSEITKINEQISENKINGILFYSKDDEISDFYEGIYINDLEIPKVDSFICMMKLLIGEPINKETLQEIKNKVSDFFTKQDYPFVLVQIPKQEVTSGVIKVKITFARLGNIEAKGAKYFENCYIAKQMRIQQGNIIQPHEILKDLVWINRNPYRKTSLYYQKGKEEGTTDIILDTTDRRTVRLYTGYENTDNSVCGYSRFYVGCNFGDLFKKNQLLNYQFLFAPDIKRWNGHVASYIIPLPWYNYLKLLGYYITTKPKSDQEIQSNGTSWQVSTLYEVPLIYKTLRNLFYLGYEFKRTNNFLSFVESTIYNQYIDISQFIFGIKTETEDSYGNTYLEADCYVSPGKMTRYNKDAYFQIERPNAKSNYVYATFLFDRVTKIFNVCRWVLNTKAQVSGAKLLPNEEISLGGYLTIRGYPENALIGDVGYYIKNEIRTSSFKFLSAIKKMKKLQDDLELLVFLDYGRAWEIDPNITNKKSHYLVSAGPGLRYNIKENLIVRFDYGVQLNKIYNDRLRSSRAHLGITLGY